MTTLTTYRVPFDGSFNLDSAQTLPPESERDKSYNKKRLKENTETLDDLQRLMYAHDHHSALFVFQAMDAGGKDSAIRNIFNGVNPAGCHVYSFKQPSSEDLQHDFLWRCHKVTPENGCFTIFNRSHYEEVLVVRVHPEYLKSQKLPEGTAAGDELWRQRFESINQFEQHLARSGTVIMKFWLNLSLEEQKNRFLSRLENPKKYWKFSAKDLEERELWPKYMAAYQEALNHTSKPWAPWYAIPADDKAFARRLISDLIVDRLSDLGMQYPDVSDEEKSKFEQYKHALKKD